MPELVRRYAVRRLATDSPFDLRDPDAAFVLKPWKDPAALRALATYRAHCYPELARDLDAWIRAIEAGPTVRGDVGARNERTARARGGGRRVATPRAGRGTEGRSGARPRRTGAKRTRRPRS
jgi:hypothetical protein